MKVFETFLFHFLPCWLMHGQWKLQIGQMLKGTVEHKCKTKARNRYHAHRRRCHRKRWATKLTTRAILGALWHGGNAEKEKEGEEKRRNNNYRHMEHHKIGERCSVLFTPMDQR